MLAKTWSAQSTVGVGVGDAVALIVTVTDGLGPPAAGDPQADNMAAPSRRAAPSQPRRIVDITAKLLISLLESIHHDAGRRYGATQSVLRATGEIHRKARSHEGSLPSGRPPLLRSIRTRVEPARPEWRNRSMPGWRLLSGGSRCQNRRSG